MKLIAAILGAFIAVFLAVPAAAAPTVQAGHYCSKSDVGKVVVADNGKTVRCEKDGEKYRWVYYTAPAPTGTSSSSKSASASSSASASASVSASASKSASATPAPATSSNQLPLTGFNAGIAVVIGVLVVAAGGGLFFAATRRRTRFTA